MSHHSQGRVFVGNIGDGIKYEDLVHVFSKYGPILEAVVKNGYAFVVFEFREDALHACEGLNGKWYLDCCLTVRMALTRKEEMEGRKDKIRRPPLTILRDSWRSTCFAAAKSLPPTSRMHSTTPTERASGRKLVDSARGFGRNLRSKKHVNDFRSAVDSYASAAKSRSNYRLTVNNLSTTIKWRDIQEFMRKEANLTLSEHRRRAECDKSLYVDFGTRRGMEDMLKYLDGMEIAGKTVRVYIDV